MARLGKLLGLISPLLAIGVAALMLFAPIYGYEAADSEGNFTSGTMNALEEGDDAWLFWSGFVVVVCMIAAVGALAGRVAPVWGCAIILLFLAVVGMWSVGLFVLPLSMVLFASAALLTAAR
jgi:hypothetical protein